ncbi:MAG: rane protease subunit, stomatin/prohibitin, partial [Mycobacterium sp.]|nr:rane protease subunit, stomatin/prohibitin [Mycobacterium sp.]
TALQGFTKMLGAPGEDGVFRYEPSPVEENLPKPEDDSAEVAEWFNTKTDPEIAQAVAQAVAEARTPVSGAIDAPPQYAPLSQQAQPPATDYLQQPSAPRHGNPGQ